MADIYWRCIPFGELGATGIPHVTHVNLGRNPKTIVTEKAQDSYSLFQN